MCEMRLCNKFAGRGAMMPADARGETGANSGARAGTDTPCKEDNRLL
jgi:hypothetical protein